jgi:thiol:disulfide interchange protein DsbD
MVHAQRLTFLLSVICLLLSPSLALPPAKPTIDTHLNYDQLHPGQQAVIAITVSIPADLHSQSNTPTEPTYIPFSITPDAVANVTFLPVTYPKGHDVTYPDLGPLNVYTGRVTAYLPLQLGQVPPGPLRITGRLQIQLCNDQTCFEPFRGAKAIPFSVETTVVPPGEPASPTNADLFANFDPRIFTTLNAAQPPPAEIQFLGYTFALPAHSYLIAFALAFVIGIIFNLMPCVLPVLPLKALGFYEASQHNRPRCFLLGLIFSLGMLAIFALLAVLIIIENQAWGELFAKSWFVWSITAILLVMALGQLGLFAIVLPNSVYNFVPTHSSFGGNFLFGGFTAILSTPCTAPMFVGLLAWSASQPQWIGVAAILTVGLGMASPYLLLAAFPDLTRKLPRTGPWSELLKQFMAFLLLAVAAWFAAGRLVTGNSYLWIVFAIIAAGSIFLIIRTAQISRPPRLPSTAISTVIALLLTGIMFFVTRNLTRESITWQPYTPDALESALNSHRPVMLEFTANWCANCKELESRVFTSPRVLSAIGDLNVVPLRADLTEEDAPGWPKLRAINPAGGIPLTLIYFPGQKEPIQLSSLYTTDNLLSALRSSPANP